jgi:hypothetical protein
MSEQRWPMMQWDGTNIRELALFLRGHIVTLDVYGSTLQITGPGELELILTRGDWLMLDGDQLGHLKAEMDEYRLPPQV